MAFEMTERRRKIVKWAGYPLLALVTFVLTLSYTFPYARLKDKIEGAFGPDVEVDVGSIGPTLLPGGVVAESVLVEARGEAGGDGEADDGWAMLVDELSVRAGLFSLLTGSGRVAVDVAIGDGEIRGRARYSGGDLDAEVSVRDLSLARVPAEAGVKLPMTGTLELDFDIELPDMDLTQGSGALSLACEACTIGDGETKLDLSEIGGGHGRRHGGLYDGELTIPEISLGSVEADVTLDDGHGEIRELSATSADGELYVSGEIEFEDPIMRSELPGCVRYRLSEEFRDRESGFALAVRPNTGAQEDGFYELPLVGSLEEFGMDPRHTCEGERPGGVARGSSGPRERPTVTIDRDDDDDRGEGEGLGDRGEVGEGERERPTVTIDRDDDDEDARGEGEEVGEREDDDEASADESEDGEDDDVRRRGEDREVEREVIEVENPDEVPIEELPEGSRAREGDGDEAPEGVEIEEGRVEPEAAE